MTDRSRRLARKMADRPTSVRYVLGSVVAVDLEGCEVDLGDRTVDAVVSPLVGGVAIDQGVRVSVQGNIYTVESVTDGSGWITGGFTALSGWSVDTATYRMSGALVTVALRMIRTGADIDAGSTGNLTDIDVVTVPSEIVPGGDYPLTRVPFMWQANRSMGSGSIEIPSGVASLNDLHSTGQIATGESLYALIHYPLT